MKPFLAGKVINATSVASVILFQIGCSTSQQSSEPPPFTFIQMTDPHIGGSKGESKLYRTALQEANSMKPAFVVVTGDLTNEGNTNESEFTEFNEISTNLDYRIPLYLVPGNHDIGNDPTSTSVLNYLGYVRQMDYYSFDLRNNHFVVLDSTLCVTTSSAVKAEAQNQTAWLTRDLARASAEKPNHIIIFMHHPLFEYSPEEHDPETGEKDEAGQNTFERHLRKEMIGLFSSNHVDYVFAGHLHENAETNAGDLHMITTGSLTPQVGPGRTNSNPGFQIVTVYRNHITFRYQSLPMP